MHVLGPGVAELALTSAERGDLAALVDGVDLSSDLGSLDVFPSYWAALPAGVRTALATMRARTGVSALVIRDSPLREPVLPTPTHWRGRPADATRRHDVWLALLAGQLGAPVCWSTLQDGRLFQDVLPIAGEERQQTGHSSLSELSFHVEDCFSDDRCDVLALLCVRNPERTPTTVATTEALDLSALDVAALCGDNFVIRPDPEHLRDTGQDAVDLTPRPVLSQEDSGLRLRVDPAFTEPAADDRRCARALDALHEQLAANLVPVRLEPGDLLLGDNRRAVHGRGSFRPRYDGTDRWLRKLTTTYDPTVGTVVTPFADRG
jgi:L-asparagine oxygenase